MASLFDEAYDSHKLGKLNEAMNKYIAALNSNFDDAKTLFYLGTCLFQLGWHGAAASFLARCLNIRPGDVDALMNLAACYRNENLFDAAEEIWQMAAEQARAKKLPIDEAGAIINIGGLYVHRGQHAKALPYFERGAAIDPTNEHAMANKAMAQLALGHWREGWLGYDTHLAINSRRERRYKDTPVWQGEPGKSVVVYGEQGVGDEIMFASMIPDLMKVASRVIFDCHPRLVSTWERSLGIACYGTRKTTDIPWFDKERPDCALAIGSLGRYFRNDEASFPGTPFLKPDPAAVLGHRARNGSGRLRIGVSWKGGSKITGGPFRQVALAELEPLFRMAHADWFSLQYSEGALEEVLAFEEQTGIRLKHYPSFVNPFDLSGLVDFVASLDLVISVPTTVVHVAGALGIPCWVMVQNEAAWRVTGNTEDTVRREKMVWYDSVKLLHKGGDTWAPLLARIKHELQDVRDFRAAAE